MVSIENVVDLYIRVSTTEQAEEGFSVEEQENKLRSYCAAYGYTINNVCVDPGVTGATMARPGLHKLIEDVQAGRCKRVLVWKLDRLSRSQKDTLILLEDVFLANDCDFISLMESFDTSTPFGRCIIGILAAFAQMERENIKARTMMGRAARIRKGYFSGSHCPIGYKFKEGSNDLIVDEYSSVIIKEAFELFLSGKGLAATGRILFDKYGSSLYDWSKHTAVRRVLANPVYMGKVKHNGEVFDGLHEPLVSEKDWYAVNAVLEHNKAIDKRTYKYTIKSGAKADNLLAGLVFCGDCGARMYAKKISKNIKRYVCYSVVRGTEAMIKSDCCTNRLHPYTAEQLEDIIIGEIRKLSTDRAHLESMIKTCSDKPQDTSALEARISEINRQTDRLLNLFQTGLVGLDEISERLGSLKDEKAKLQATINDLKVPTAPSADAIWDMSQGFAAAVDTGDLDTVHSIVNALIDKIVVLNDDITIYWSFA